MSELPIMTWNLYSHEVHEIKFMPPLPKDYREIYGGVKNEHLITGRTPHMCLYQAHRAEREKDTLYNVSGEWPETQCVLHSLTHTNAYKWVHDPPGRDTCEPTEDTVQFMEWRGDACLKALPIQSVYEWQTARNTVFKRCLQKLVKDIPIMCFQEVDSSNIAMLKSLQSSNSNLKLYTDLKGHINWSCHYERGLAILFDASKLELQSYYLTETGPLPCTQVLTFNYHGTSVCLCNIHMYVKDHEESYLLDLLNLLKGWHPHVEVFVMAGDMNMRSRMTSESWSANCKIKDDSLDHILAHSVADDTTIALIPMSSKAAQITKCTEKGQEIKKALDVIEKRLRRVQGGGHLVDKKSFSHWMSDHEPLVAALEISLSTRGMQVEKPKTSNERRRTHRLSPEQINSP